MQILIINPNSDPNMTKAIQDTAEKYAQSRFKVNCLLTPGAPQFIETYQDIMQSVPGMISLLRENHDAFDAFIIACHYDPNLDALKEISEKPVVGIGQASMMMASMLGHKFSIVTTDQHSVSIHFELARQYHYEDLLASVRAPEQSWSNEEERIRYLWTARSAIKDDGAEVIVLGCAGLAGLDKYIQNELRAPVLDGIICALILVEGLVKYG